MARGGCEAWAFEAGDAFTHVVLHRASDASDAGARVRAHSGIVAHVEPADRRASRYTYQPLNFGAVAGGTVDEPACVAGSRAGFAVPEFTPDALPPAPPPAGYAGVGISRS